MELDFILALEGGEPMDEEQIAEGLQPMIDSGIVWQLQGFYGRLAQNFIQMGLCHA
jgi:hypothetical protein